MASCLLLSLWEDGWEELEGAELGVLEEPGLVLVQPASRSQAKGLPIPLYHNKKFTTIQPHLPDKITLIELKMKLRDPFLVCKGRVVILLKNSRGACYGICLQNGL